MPPPPIQCASAIACSPGQLLRRIAIFAALVGAIPAAAMAADPPDPTTGATPTKTEPGHLDEARMRELAPGQERSARVMAAEEQRQSSGVPVRDGQTYRIEASGEWKAGTLCNPTGPGGKDAYTLLCFPNPIDTPIVRGFSFGTLIAKIGRDGPPFALGDRLDFEATRDGLLYLRINEGPGWAWDNRGHVTAVIRLVGDGAASARPPDAAAADARASTAAPAAASAPRAQHWAVVVGVSEYADSRIPSLRYATADAKAVYDWLVAPDGGRYAPARVRLLVDREATATNIRDALFNWLRQAIAEDVVLIYFAGHGSPDSPDSANNLFLLLYDTRYDNVAATGFPMWDIETALKRFIPARRVVVIADACHSGGVGASYDIARRSAGGLRVNPIASGLQSLSKVGDGIAVISASDERQLSAEGARFGGGHGVFTYFPIEGLSGQRTTTATAGFRSGN